MPFMEKFLTLPMEGGGIFYRCILTGGAMKLSLYDFSSNFILEMWVKIFFSSDE